MFAIIMTITLIILTTNYLYHNHHIDGNATQVTEHEVQNSVRSIPKLDTLILVKVGFF